MQEAWREAQDLCFPSTNTDLGGGGYTADPVDAEGRTPSAMP